VFLLEIEASEDWRGKNCKWIFKSYLQIIYSVILNSPGSFKSKQNYKSFSQGLPNAYEVADRNL
jgi:hypothetical protein